MNRSNNSKYQQKNKYQINNNSYPSAKVSIKLTFLQIGIQE